MDIPCPRCGEPFDFFEIQQEFTEEERRRFYSGEGCPCCYGKPMKTTDEKKMDMLWALLEVSDDDEMILDLLLDL